MNALYILLLQLSVIITGLACLRQKGPVLLWIILIITTVSALNENILVFHATQWWGISTNFLYNIYGFLDIIAWGAVYFIIFKQHRYLKRSIPFLWIALVSLRLAEGFSRGFTELFTLSLIFFCVMNILLAIFYFSVVITRSYHDLTADYSFYLCSASLCFHPVLLVNLLTVSYTRYWENELSVLTFDALQVTAITFYNLFICAAFIVFYYRRRRRLGPTLF